ncbi:hypothetical protein [Streptomyces chartreusis]
MSTEAVVALVTAVASVTTTLLAGYFGPRWKDRVDTRRAAQERSEQLLAQYSEPLARAAFDLQSRIYNICMLDFMTDSELSGEYRRLSTLWFFAQFLAWGEILRREVQIIDYGDVRKTAAFQQRLFDVTEILAHGPSASHGLFHLYRAEQRAIGELMVMERAAEGRSSDSMGYAEFVQRIEGDPVFARWFEPLDADIGRLTDGASVGVRAVLVQRALVGLIDFCDPQQVRFPNLNERGRIPLPEGYEDRKLLSPTSQVARFRLAADPISVVNSWANENCLHAVRSDNEVRVALPRRWSGNRHDIIVKCQQPWVEIHVVARDQHIQRQYGQDGQRRASLLAAEEIALLNRLLYRFDRPVILRRGRQ